MLITRAVWNIKPGGMIGRQPIWEKRKSLNLFRILSCPSAGVCAEVRFLGGGMWFADPLGGL
jgi:hypothetical protein